MTPLDWYVLVFSPIVLVALAAVPILWARHDLKRSGEPAPRVGHRLGSRWQAAAHD